MKIRAIGLMSGGLDSCLAVKIIQEQNIEVLALSFETPFFSAQKSIVMCGYLNVPIRVIDFTEEHLQMLKNPRYGYGKNMNPCIDCHGLMFKKAGELMHLEKFDFIFTGEVLNERPMSQNSRALRIVEKLSGLKGFILRPLSAKLLDETVPELEGKVDRTRLLDICGKGRLRQMELAANYGLTDYPTPAGGCLLTDINFSKRLRDFLSICENPSRNTLDILKYGRILKLSEKARLIVGRNENENNKITELAEYDDILIDAADFPGPTGLLMFEKNDGLIKLSAEIIAAFSKTENNNQVSVTCGDKNILVDKKDKSLYAALYQA